MRTERGPPADGVETGDVGLYHTFSPGRARAIPSPCSRTARIALLEPAHRLHASAAALTAAHAELEAEDFAASPHPPSAQACLAGALLTQVEALQHSLRRYRTLVVMREEWARVAPASELSPS
ncbi:hypothetical protein [Archangium sp.]|uniref:hypothetical protein n=1 Tax=Archangium sp. TaxID=1872627 RepID=UPI002E2F53A1|nr:hypothetical protein [Archangium sp.]